MRAHVIVGWILTLLAVFFFVAGSPAVNALDRGYASFAGLAVAIAAALAWVAYWDARRRRSKKMEHPND